MMSLNQNDINKADAYTVTVIEKGETNPPTDEGKDDDPQPQPQPQPQPEPELNKDGTTIKQEIPKAGLNKILGITISVITIFSVIMYRKNKKYKGII
jgi:hypothetical protein